MTTSKLLTSQRRNVSLFAAGDFGFKPTFYTKDDGTRSIKDMPVFRSGSFADSMGYRHNFEQIHMDQMVMHFDMLRARKIFADVPVRDGHAGFLIRGLPGNGKTVGWHTGLRTEDRKSPVDGKDYTYLLADYDILDEEAKVNIDSGLWRNRSSEIGEYETNDETMFWPVYMGVAYVDIPAVEGLNGFDKIAELGGVATISGFAKGQEDRNFICLLEKEIPVGDKPGTDAGSTPPVAPPVAPPVVVPPQPIAAASPPAATHSFTIQGAATTDFGAVQRHISALEQFQVETREQSRKDFVASLAAGDAPKITQPQVAAQTEVALMLDDNQYAKWKASWDAAPSSSLLAVHGSDHGQGGSTDPAQTADQKLLDDISIQEDIVRNHTRNGVSPESLKKLPSFVKLQELKAQLAAK